jgi:molybdate transport system substrate-binding protein
MKWFLLTALAVTAGTAPGKAPKKTAIKVAAAENLALAFKEVGAAFEKQTGTPVTFIFGSTGGLAKQLAEGAPFDVFAAANVAFVDEAVRAGACDGQTKALYARGRIVAWTRDGIATPPAKVEDLADKRYIKISLANPEHAPYGKAAREALQNAKIWEQVKGRVVYGENIKQALQYAQSGNTEVAMTALALAIVTPGGKYLLVDESLHAPLDQALVVCKHGSDAKTGAAFATFVNSPAGREIMKRFGFSPPPDVAQVKR